MIILNTPEQAVHWLREKVSLGRLGVDSRKIGVGDGFIAWPGAATDGRYFVEGLLNHGIAACLVEKDERQWPWENDARVAFYSGLKAGIASIADLYYGHPSEQLAVVAVTGTNGKTSSSWWVAQALSLLGKPCGVIGTLGVGMLGDLQSSSLTTPDPVRIHQVLANLIGQGSKACAIEASSIGLEEHRFDCIKVKVALLTNVTQDHLDYHKTMQAYWQSKKKLFFWNELACAVVNIDDAYGVQLAQELAQHKGAPQCYTYSAKGNKAADFYACDVKYTETGSTFTIVFGEQQVRVNTGLIGEYNIANLLGVAGVLAALGYQLADIVRVFQMLSPVPGRMQLVPCLVDDGLHVIVDYAHTPDALQSVLTALRPVVTATGGKLWCVFGCGGDRDPVKRPLMGKIAQAYADAVVVTSDNPRTQAPLAIIEQILAGMNDQQPHLYVEENRQAAIALALELAKPKDVVLIAGKGHEPYQEINGVRYPFSDMAVAMQIRHRKAFQSVATGDQAMLTLQQARALLQSQGVTARLFGDAQTDFCRVHTDTRTLRQGDLFVALRGERFDAHDFLRNAKAAGAVAVLAERGVDDSGLPGLEVADAKKALGALAKAWRACWDLPVIAVTGSNGKTTTTQMIAGILRVFKGQAALATVGNLNNDIGVPLMLLRLRAMHKVAVFELGMNHPGEIAYLADMAQPDIALVTNAQREHQEFMHSVEAVAQENGQVIAALPQKGVAVFPLDDAYASLWQGLVHDRKAVKFALHSKEANYSAAAVWDNDAWRVQMTTPDGSLACRLHTAGQHNVKNALAAAACTQQAGVPLEIIAQGLNQFEAVKGRSQVEVLKLGEKRITLIDDSYNANPDSVCAAIDVLADLPQPSLLILGAMGEVGNQGELFHREVGEYARNKGINALWGFGFLMSNAVEAFGHNGNYFETKEQLNQMLAKNVADFSSIVVKGSRTMKMEQVVDCLHQLAQEQMQGFTGGNNHVA